MMTGWCLRKKVYKTPNSAFYTPVAQLTPLGSEIAEWLAHWLLVLEVPGSIPAGGEENLLVRTCFPSCP